VFYGAPCRVTRAGNRTATRWVTKEVTERRLSSRGETEPVSLLWRAIRLSRPEAGAMTQFGH